MPKFNKSVYSHPNVLGEGAKKRRKLSGRRKIRAVMGEYKRGKLHSGSGGIVTDRNQAVAIAFSEAGMAKDNRKKRGVAGRRRRS